MIYFEKLRYKNFLSTGNTFNEINFEESPTTLVVGQNGAGKSTMLDALHLHCLVNHIVRFRKDNSSIV